MLQNIPAYNPYNHNVVRKFTLQDQKDRILNYKKNYKTKLIKDDLTNEFVNLNVAETKRILNSKAVSDLIKSKVLLHFEIIFGKQNFDKL